MAIILILALAVLALNVVAYSHAYAFTHFSAGGAKTKNPEDMSLLEKTNALFFGINLPRPSNDVDPASVGLAFKTHTIPGAAGELEAWYVPCGNAQGLVLMFHGYGACKSILLQEARAFNQLGYSVLLMDFRGCGGSAGGKTTIGVDEADDVAGAVDYARASWPNERLVLYGQSMGSAAILRAAALNSVKVDAAIIECPFDRLIGTVRRRFSAMGLPTFPLADLLVFWGGLQNGFNGFKHNPADYAKRVSFPVLLFHGEHDPRVTKEQVETVFRNLGGDRQIEFFPAGHEPCLISCPEKWNRMVSSFLARHLK